MTFNGAVERTYASFPINDRELFKRQLLAWAGPFNSYCFLDNQGYPSKSSFEYLLAAGAIDSCTSLRQLKRWAAGRHDWLFGHIGFEMASEIEDLPPNTLPDEVGFPDLFFFVPEIIIEVQKDEVRIGSEGVGQAAIYHSITAIVPPEPTRLPSPVFTARYTREEYLSTVTELRRHILRGDCYEINFCMEFFARSISLDPLSMWWALSRSSPNPFSACYRTGGHYLFCASPERFLQKKGNTLLSQPIKGTAPRIPTDPEADRLQARTLYQSPKDRAENVMVVDLVRNDLSRICIPGTVHVPELYGIYDFPQVYHLISTVAGEIAAGLDWTDAIKAVFPMGSMTGAPKNSVLRLIRRYERSRRGLFSGTVGYVDPSGDFDFNVVIRSLLYNKEKEYLSYQVGSGITWYSDPAAEYEECLLKAEGIRKAFL